MTDMARIQSMLAELTEILRRNGYAMDIGNGDFHLYRLDSLGNDAVCNLEWDDQRGLVARDD